MNKDLLTIVTLFFFGVFIIFIFSIFFSGKKNKEGLENSDVSKVSDGIAGNAANYAAMIKAKTVLIQDSLLISKYRADYENVIINLEDLCNFLMLNQIVKMDINGDAKSNLENFNIINNLSNAKKSLNECMQFVDKQT
jgi:hypothetical protein